MPKSNIEQALNELSKTDVYSMILFSLFKLKDIKEYSTLSELAYILDNKSLLNFLEYYGGMTIKVPTKQEFKVVVNALLLYQYVNLEGIELSKAAKLIDKTDIDIDEVKDTYYKVAELLVDCDFKRN